MSPAVNPAGWRPLHVAILLLYGALLTWPALSNGYLPSRDVLIHLLWSTYFSDQLWAGEWYPRWLDGMNGGLGSPVFFFYAPLPYYVTALLKPLFHADPEGWHQLGAAASMAVILSGFAAYGWLRRLGGATAALVGAIVYMSAPYHLAFDLYRRFAFAELWSFVWLPLVLWGAQSTVRGSRKAGLGLSLAYAALVLTHLPTAMIFSPVALAWALVCAGRGGRARGTAAVVGAMALGTGLAGAYLVPALATQQNVSLADMRGGAFSYVYHFLFYGPRPNADYSSLVDQQGWYAGVMMFVCVAVFFLGGRQLGGLEARRSRFWMAVAVLVFGMMLPIARPVWDLVPPLQAIQFPWRFNTLLTLSMSALLALWAGVLASQASRLSGAALAAVCVIVIGQSLPTLAVYHALASSPGAPSMDKMLEQFGGVSADAKQKVLAAKSAIDVPEYRPRWAAPESYDTPQALRALMERVQGGPQGEGRGTVETVSHSAQRVAYAVDLPAQAWVKLPHFYYPEWRAVSVEGSADLPVRPSVPEGLLEVRVGAGRHTIVLALTPSWAERIGWAISGLSLGLLALLAALALRRTARHGQTAEFPVPDEGRVRAM